MERRRSDGWARAGGEHRWPNERWKEPVHRRSFPRRRQKPSPPDALRDPKPNAPTAVVLPNPNRTPRTNSLLLLIIRTYPCHYSLLLGAAIHSLCCRNDFVSLVASAFSAGPLLRYPSQRRKMHKQQPSLLKTAILNYAAPGAPRQRLPVDDAPADLDATTVSPIPAFYCCYLLRSKTRKSYYIGSTPNPARRLAQHNGQSKGGAKRTSMGGKRPWEMTCIVTGFPSKVAALQFEWAWQNTHATRHIDSQERAARLDAMKKGGKRSRPPMSLEARLKNLHRLLGVKSFNRWPLHIRFFAPDVHELWGKHAAGLSPKLGRNISVRLTPAQVEPSTAVSANGEPEYKIPRLIREIPVAYEDCKAHIEKSNHVFASEGLRCRVCQRTTDKTTSLLVLCPVDACTTVSHMHCLSALFLREEGGSAIVPTHGSCPGCKALLQWSTLMKELSLRQRGQAEVQALFKPKHAARARKEPGTAAVEVPGAEDAEGVEEDLDEEFPSIEKFLRLEIEDLRRTSFHLPRDGPMPGDKEECDADSDEEFPSIDKYLRMKGIA